MLSACNTPTHYYSFICKMLNTNILSHLHKRHIVLVVMLLVVVIFRHIPSLSNVYTFTIYPRIGKVLAFVSGMVPFAVGDVFITMSIVSIVVYIIYSICCKKTSKKHALCNVVEYLLWIYAWFYIAWGLNYSQPSIYQRIGFEHTTISEDMFRNFAFSYADSINAAYIAAKGDICFSNTCHTTADNELKQRTACEVEMAYNNMEGMGINRPFISGIHGKTMMFSRLSSMVGVSGSMAPFFCEFTLNADIPRHAYPAIYAHEYSHMLGIANEGEANFYSYVACITSNDRLARFSGYYHILPYILRDATTTLRTDDYAKLTSHIHPDIIQIAAAERQYWNALRCHTIANVQNFAYNIYLHGNNVDGGTKSYSMVIDMILSWQHATKKDKSPNP